MLTEDDKSLKPTSGGNTKSIKSAEGHHSQSHPKESEPSGSKSDSKGQVDAKSEVPEKKKDDDGDNDDEDDDLYGNH